MCKDHLNNHSRDARRRDVRSSAVSGFTTVFLVETRWAPDPVANGVINSIYIYTYIYIYTWPYKWLTGVITLLIFGRGPP